MRRHPIPFVLLSTLAAACAADVDTALTDPRAVLAQSVDPAADAATDAEAEPAKVGEFSFQLVAPVPEGFGRDATPGFTSLLGKVYQAPLPEALIWEKQVEVDGCTLLTPRVPFCDPGCGIGICVEDGVCQASPPSVGVGTLTVKGVRTEDGQTSFSIDPIRNNYLTPASIRLPYPAFAEGDPIEVATSGGALAPFSIAAKGIAPLALADDVDYVLGKGKPLALRWTAAKPETGSRIQIKLDISHHGGTKGKIECDVADDGEHTISGDLVGRLMDLGVAGFPTVLVTRAQVGSTQTAAGRVDLRIFSYVETAVEIPGVVSCSDDPDCPSSQRCRDDRTCG